MLNNEAEIGKSYPTRSGKTAVVEAICFHASDGVYGLKQRGAAHRESEVHMAKCFIISPAQAQFIASCLMVGCEGAPDDAFADAHSEGVHELIAEFESWGGSDFATQVTFERHEDEDDAVMAASRLSPSALLEAAANGVDLQPDD